MPDWTGNPVNSPKRTTDDRLPAPPLCKSRTPGQKTRHTQEYAAKCVKCHEIFFIRAVRGDVWGRCGAANQPGRCTRIRTHTKYDLKWNKIKLKKIKKTGSQQRFKVDFGEIGEPVVISDALVVDCALTGLLPPAPPANPAFPVRPLAQTAGHANTLSPLMFSREGGGGGGTQQGSVSVAPLRHRAASELLWGWVTPLIPVLL